MERQVLHMQPLQGIQRVKNVPLYLQVAEQIERIIFRGEYYKGDLLPSERELMEQTGVSRITVREALQHLAEVGIIKTQKGKGSTVIVSVEELLAISSNREKYQNHRRNFENSTNARVIIEPEIARQVALSANDAIIKSIGDHLFENKRATEAPKPSKRLEGFHRAIVLALDNPVMLEIFDSLTALEANDQPVPIAPPSEQASIVQKLNEHHNKIFEAIKSKDGEFAYFYMKEHTLFLMSTYQQFFDHYFA